MLYKAGDFSPVFNNIFTANIFGMWKKRGVLYLQCAGATPKSAGITIQMYETSSY